MRSWPQEAGVTSCKETDSEVFECECECECITVDERCEDEVPRMKPFERLRAFNVLT